MCSVDGIGVARIFSEGGVNFLLDQISDDLFLVIVLFYMFMYIIYCHQLPFYLICGAAPHQIHPIFASSQQKCLENFFRRPGGAPAPPEYVYGGW